MKCKNVMMFMPVMVKDKLEYTQTNRFPEKLIGKEVITVGRCAMEGYIFVQEDHKSKEAYMIHRKDIRKIN